MFQKSIEAIIAQGIKGLESLKKEAAATSVQAQAEVQRCQSEIQTLVNLGKQVPEKVFDRYSSVLVSTIESRQDWENFYGEIRLGSASGQLRGLMGNEILKMGRYRVIVLLEPIS